MKLLSGKEIAKIKSIEIIDKIKKLNFKPSLVIVLVGDNYASKKYISYKIKKADELNINARLLHLPKSISQIDLINTIKTLNDDVNIHGYIVQLPLPKHIDSKVIQEYVDPKKDVDGLSIINAGRLFENVNNYIMPATPKGIISILDYYEIHLQGKVIAMIGRSSIVGKPLSIALLNRNATVIMCHSKTDMSILKYAEIIISATGVPNLIKAKMVKYNVVIIDVGINRDKNNKLTGDVDFDDLKGKASAMTPVPGGVGPMTIISIFENLLTLINRNT